MSFPFISATLTTAAKSSAIGEKVLREACDSGELPCHWVGNKRIIRAADLDEWVTTLPTERAS